MAEEARVAVVRVEEARVEVAEVAVDGAKGAVARAEEARVEVAEVAVVRSAERPCPRSSS